MICKERSERLEQKTGDLKKEVSNVNDRIDNFEKKTEF